MVVLLDDSDIILGIEFFVQDKAALLPYIRGLSISESNNPYFVDCRFVFKNTSNVEVMYALQLN